MYSSAYCAIFKDDLKPSPGHLREMASALEHTLENFRPSPEGWSHAELFAPTYLRQYANLLEKHTEGVDTTY